MVKQVLDIEALLHWTYQKQKAHKMGVGLNVGERVASGLEWQRASACGCVAMERQAALGVSIGGSGFRVSVVHPDAEAVHAVVSRLPASERSLVIEHALAGTRPDWMPGAKPILRPMRNGRGGVMMIYDRSKNAVGCRVEFVLGPETIAYHRAQYAAWWSALRGLVMSVRLASRYPTGPEAQREPWNTVDITKSA
ncbi:MAG: hypothetical protein ABT940_09965 [Alphaproteobacteria bacterium]